MKETDSQVNCMPGGTQGQGESAGREYLSIRQTAKLLGVGRQRVTELLPDIPGVKRLSPRTIRIPRKGIEALFFQ